MGGPSPEDLAAAERWNAAYGALVAMLYNFAPMSGHPGGSMSMGRIASGLVLRAMAYDIGDPDGEEHDVLSLAAGHKAMGLYAMLALRDEMVRIARPELLPAGAGARLRFEDLLGFRRNATDLGALARSLATKPLDGHPTPATPFVRLATGPSGVGVASSVGLALAALDLYGERAPLVHVMEGEGGMTAGRVSEAMACASSCRLTNLVIHLDWNQATIDSERCCREGTVPGDYVQWDPVELALLHDFNVIFVPDGHDQRQVDAAQALALDRPNLQPTCIVYRTVKGRGYGIEGRRSHGAGHPFLGQAFHEALRPFEQAFGASLPRASAEPSSPDLETVHWQYLQAVRSALEAEAGTCRWVAGRVARAREALAAAGRKRRDGAPDLTAFTASPPDPKAEPPRELALAPGSRATLRGALGAALGHVNRRTRGAVLGCAADLLDSTSVSALAAGMPAGLYRWGENPGARLFAAGGICEDAMAGISSGISSMGGHVGVASSYAAFIAPLAHISARCHAIGQQARECRTGRRPDPFVLVMGHASIETGEDGPTHADPQALQLYQGNFVHGLCVTLTPWDPAEVWPLLARALAARPAVIAAFVTRPDKLVPDRAALGLPPAHAAALGIYEARTANRDDPGWGGTVIVQGSGVASEFFCKALPRLESEGVRLEVLYVASSELFDMLSREEREAILPPERAAFAIGITDFTMPTLHGFVTSQAGRDASLHPLRGGRYLGSGKASSVLREAGLDAQSQYRAVLAWADEVRSTRSATRR